MCGVASPPGSLRAARRVGVVPRVEGRQDTPLVRAVVRGSTPLNTMQSNLLEEGGNGHRYGHPLPYQTASTPLAADLLEEGERLVDGHRFPRELLLGRGCASHREG